MENANVGANMIKSCFYVCPVCGNSIHAMGQAHVSCHGIVLPPLIPESADDQHVLRVSGEADELFVQVEHPMSKQHHIVFLAAVSPDCVQIARLYPEGPAETHFKRTGVSNLYAHCNRDGLFSISLKDVLH